jgi:hypothetical protein
MTSPAARARHPAVDLQVSGPDGTIYRIPAAELSQFAIEQDRAFEVPPEGGIGFTEVDGVTMLVGPDHAPAAMTPSVFFRLIRVGVEMEFDDQLEAALGDTPHQVSVPSTLLSRLHQLGHGGAGGRGRGARVGRESFSRVSVNQLGAAIRDAVGAGKATEALRLFRGLDELFTLSLPLRAANDVKRLVREVRSARKSSRPQWSVLDTVLRSRCGGGTQAPDGGSDAGGGGPPPQNEGCRKTRDTNMSGCPH